MPIIAIEQAKEYLEKGQTVLAIDYGTKNIGIAVSDALLFTASPLTTIRHTKFTEDVLLLADIIKEKNVSIVVIGMPLNMNGTQGPRCQSTKSFADNLLQSDVFENELKIVFQDERMSSKAVERIMIQADLSRKRRKEVIDKSAASYILQGVLDRLKNL